MSSTMQPRPSAEGGTAPSERQRHWLGQPVCRPVEGSFEEVLDALPQFGRQPFSMPSVNGDELGINSYLDMIYRMPIHQSKRPMPVGVVSKNYRLVDHHLVLRTVQHSLGDLSLDLQRIRVFAEWTIYGERAHFSIVFPPQEQFIFGAAGTDDEMRFRIEIFNSVDGSYRLMAVAGWLRFVCLNGLILGAALLQLQEQHRQQLEVQDVGNLVGQAIKLTSSDRAIFERWMATEIDRTSLSHWIDEEVRQLWGLKAAVRILGIITDGWDVELIGDTRNRNPTEIRTKRARLVPGMVAPASNLLAVSQALSWLAGQRAEIGGNFEWRTQVHDLINKLTKIEAPTEVPE